MMKQKRVRLIKGQPKHAKILASQVLDGFTMQVFSCPECTDCREAFLMSEFDTDDGVTCTVFKFETSDAALAAFHELHDVMAQEMGVGN